MKISKINNTYKIGFSSLRTDKNQISALKTGSMPILENRKENILASLNRMANTPDRANIEFLLDIAENLTYGQNGNSEFKDIIDESTDAPEERENTDWSKLLSDTISQAISKSDEDTSDLQARFGEVFNSKHPLTVQQQEVLQLRNQFKQAVVNEKSIEDADSLTRSANVSKNIDYFISSSEISLAQKKECLEKFLYLLSDEYPINPQLADKKVQIVDEMLNDMLIKVPNQTELTTKGVDQLYSGICAAISICRKAVAYEDKSRYMDIVLEELKDSDTMEVFDVTELESDKTVKIPKIAVDYDAAISEGYRILDASAHLWMQNAHSSGNGTIQSETFVAFDDSSYGVFNDSSWYEGFNPDLAPEKTLLENLIKEKELLDSVTKSKRKYKEASSQILQKKQEAIQIQSSINGELNRTFKQIFPDMTDSEITRLERSIISFYQGSQPDNEQNISEKMPDDVKKDIISTFIRKESQTPEDDKTTNQAIDENVNKIIGLIEEYIDTDNSIKKLSSFNSKKSKYVQNRRLYQLAAAHRMSVEADVNLKTGVIRFEKISGLPTRRQQIVSYLEKLGSSFRENKSAVIEHFSKGKSKNKLEQDLLQDILKIEETIPHQLDDISRTLYGIDTKEQTKEMLQSLREEIKFGRKDLGAMVAGISGIKNDKTEVIAFLDKQIKKFNNDISDDDLDEIIRILGFEDRVTMAATIFSQFVTGLNNGISEEQFANLAQRFGGQDKINPAIEAQQAKLKSVYDEYYSIQKRWEVPTQRQLILEKMEKDHTILPYKRLDLLKSRFSYIRSQQSKNDNIQNKKERQKANDKLYTFTNQEQDILDSIEASLPSIKKYAKTAYDTLNKELFDDLEKQYADIGMLNGQFWVREEGSSGLSANEQVRIIEQMTGKPYHIEPDIEKAAKQIKQGEGSGIISYSVDDESYAFHAQYVPAVTSEKLDSEKEAEDVVWTDNSWGRAEKKDSFWKGRNGYKYTDYGSGYGWKNGFILADDMRIGQSVQNIKTGVGYEAKDKEKFGLFLDMVLPGTPVNAYQKLYKMFNYILSMNQGSEFYNALEEALKNGADISIKELEGIDDVVEHRTSVLNKQVDSIKSKEDWDKLPNDSFLKFVMEVLSVYMAANNPQIADVVMESSSIEELEDAKDDLMDDIIDDMGSIICKSDGAVERMMLACYEDLNEIFDEINKKYNVPLDKAQRAEILEQLFYGEEDDLKNLSGSIKDFEEFLLKQVDIVAEKSFDNVQARKFFTDGAKKVIQTEIEEYMKVKNLESPILLNSPVHDLFIAAVDKYLEPTSDRELIDLIAGLQYADYDKANVFLEALQPEDLGLEFKDPYEYIQKLQTGDSAVSKAFYEIIATNVINSYLNRKNQNVNVKSDDESPELATPEDLYRNLYVKLTEMDVQKYIRDFKAEAFRKYKVRQAFPQPIVITDDEIAETCSQMFKYFGESIVNINSSNYIISIFDEYEKILTEINSSCFAQLFTQGLDFKIENETQAKELNEFISKLSEFINLLGQDESLSVIKKPADNLLTVLKTQNNRTIDGRKTRKALNEIKTAFDNWNDSGITREKFTQTKKEEIEELKGNIQVFANANVIPAHRNEATERLSKILTLMAKNGDNEEIEYLQNEFTDFLINKHIVKDPTKILSECVKMVQNAHESISSKTKDLLPMFNVTLTDGSKYGMNSEMGMIYLINQLENESDNYTALKLFLAQSGLSEPALTALINTYNEDKSREVIDETYDEITGDIKDYAQLNSIIDTFLKQNRIPFKSLESAVKHLNDFVKRKSKNSDRHVYKHYLEYLNAVDIRKELNNVSKDMIVPLLLSINKNASEYVSESVNAKIDYLAGISNILEDRNKLIEIIDVPEDSEAFKQRADFRERYQKLQNHLQSKLQAIQQLIEQSEFLSAEYVDN